MINAAKKNANLGFEVRVSSKGNAILRSRTVRSFWSYRSVLQGKSFRFSWARRLYLCCFAYRRKRLCPCMRVGSPEPSGNRRRQRRAFCSIRHRPNLMKSFVDMGEIVVFRSLYPFLESVTSYTPSLGRLTVAGVTPTTSLFMTTTAPWGSEFIVIWSSVIDEQADTARAANIGSIIFFINFGVVFLQ